MLKASMLCVGVGYIPPPPPPPLWRSQIVTTFPKIPLLKEAPPTIISSYTYTYAYHWPEHSSNESSSPHASVNPHWGKYKMYARCVCVCIHVHVWCVGVGVVCAGRVGTVWFTVKSRQADKITEKITKVYYGRTHCVCMCAFVYHVCV